MRQQLVDAAGRMCRHPLQHILEVRVGLVPVDAGRVHQAHHGRCSLAGTQATCEQPVRPADGHRPDVVLHPGGRQLS